jgi:hypothetical protein
VELPLRDFSEASVATNRSAIEAADHVTAVEVVPLESINDLRRRHPGRLPWHYRLQLGDDGDQHDFYAVLARRLEVPSIGEPVDAERR